MPPSSGRGCFFREDKSRQEMADKDLNMKLRTYMVLVPSLIGRKAVL